MKKPEVTALPSIFSSFFIPPAVESACALPLQMPHILSVSYDAMLLRTRQMVLESRGYEVTSAEGFDDALEKCKSGHYDLVIIGHSIPYDDKRSIARQLNFYCPAPILVLLTNGESPLPEAVECFEPSKPEQLLAAVERVLPPAKRAQAD